MVTTETQNCRTLTSPPILPSHLFIDLLKRFPTSTWSWSITSSAEDKNEWSYTTIPQCAFTVWARTFFLFIVGGVLTDIDRYLADNLSLCCAMAVLPNIASCARIQSPPPHRGACKGVEVDAVQVMSSKKTPRPMDVTPHAHIQAGSGIYERKFPSFQFRNTYLTLQYQLVTHELASRRCKT
jgi:hypothetical protein